ncbi:hypothetical protein SNE40_009470 [Patella caerulea]|uniref:Ig-like domain-containing protein n=1 Tax=Patella caerulea TaxID=87958 RepID=A0AAN8JRB2_PATCE
MELIFFTLLQLSILRISYGCECESHILEAGRVQLSITPSHVLVGGETCLCCDQGDADGTVKFILGDTQICKIVNGNKLLWKRDKSVCYVTENGGILHIKNVDMDYQGIWTCGSFRHTSLQSRLVVTDTTVPTSTNTAPLTTPNITTTTVTRQATTTTERTTATTEQTERTSTTTERTTTIQQTTKFFSKPIKLKSTNIDELYKTTTVVPGSSTTEANNNHWLQLPLKELIPYIIMTVIVILLVTLIIIKLVSMVNKRNYDKYGNKKLPNARHHIYDNIDDRNIPPTLPPPRNDLQDAIEASNPDIIKDETTLQSVKHLNMASNATEKTSYYLTPDVSTVNQEHKNITPQIWELPLVETSHTKTILSEENKSYLTPSTIINRTTMLSDHGGNKQSDIRKKENVSGNTTTMKLDETDLKPSIYTNTNAVDNENGIILNEIVKTVMSPTTENKYTPFPEETSIYLTPVHVSSGLKTSKDIKSENTVVTENEYATIETPEEKSTKRTPIIHTKK